MAEAALRPRLALPASLREQLDVLAAGVSFSACIFIYESSVQQRRSCPTRLHAQLTYAHYYDKVAHFMDVYSIYLVKG